MAKNTFKRSIAMLLVLNMLTGMLPIQALAEEGNTEAPVITVTVTPSESAPKAEKTESAPAEKTESAPAEKTESAPAEKTESAPAEKTESAPAEKTESAPAEKTESAPAEKTESAPAEKTESAPAEKTESAPAEKTESAPAEKTESAPAEKTETASAEVVSYDGGEDEKIEHDTNLTLGEKVDVTVSKETVTSADEEGNDVVIETTEVTTIGTADNGDKVEGEETFTETTTTTTTEITVESVLEGEQTTTSEDLPVEAGEEVPEVVAPIVPGAEDVEEGTVTDKVEGEDGTVTETTTTIEKVTDENGKESVKVTVVETKTEPTDDVQDGDADFDITQVESTTIEREVTIETTGTVEVTDQSSTDLEAIAPEDYEGKAFDNKEGLLNGITPDALQSYADQVAKPDAEGYIYQWTGYAEATNAVRAVGVDVVYKKDENGNALVDENGDYIIESITYTGKYGDGMDSTPSIFALTKYDEEGNAQSYYYAYCIDHDTEAQPGSWYKITNLEDSDYYPDEESAAKLRAVVTNGYFGTEEGTGSFAQMKEKLEAYYDENAEVTIDDKDGNPVTFKVADVLGRLNEADALAVTQTAIWSYANGTLGLQDGKDGGLIKAIYSVVKPKSNLANCDRDYDYERDAALKAMYEWLLAIEPIEQGSDDVSTVINEKNFVDDMSLTIKDKVEDHEDNKDDKDDNDVYNTELNFTLAFVPDQKTDDLLVYLLDDQGNKIKDADGNDIVKRLAGENSEGREADTITADENGVYTLTGIQLSENSEYKFDLQLEGTQYLKEGVYVYTAHGGVSASQTMVGMASGTQNVNVKASMSIKFEVDESKTVVATRKWRETTEEVTPRETEDNPPPAEYRLGFGVGQLEVIEEEVPLAAPPQTGDMSILWFAMIVMSGCGLCILNLLEKRKCRA